MKNAIITTGLKEVMNLTMAIDKKVTEIGGTFEAEYRKESIITGSDVTLEMIKLNPIDAMNRIEVWLSDKNISLTDAIRDLNSGYRYVTDVWRRVTSLNSNTTLYFFLFLYYNNVTKTSKARITLTLDCLYTYKNNSYSIIYILIFISP